MIKHYEQNRISHIILGIILAFVPFQALAATGPCDVFASGSTPCVAAFSTVRALYNNYTGNLYQVRRTSDNATKEIGVLTTGGVANSATQDAFCTASGSCTISIIYDQSGNGNNLTKAPGGSTTYGPNNDVEAVADALPVYINGHKTYGVHVVGSSSWTSTGQVGYRTKTSKGVATGDNPESIYMVTDGTYYNGSCCFDFGNALMTPTAGANGSMDALYFGSCTWWDKGAGSGPWIMADLESGVYNRDGAAGATNTNDISFNYQFVTAILKSNKNGATTGGPFTLKGGNAQSGSLQTIWDGARPTNYATMAKGGGIVLGIGGDNSSMAHGNFFEGVMTSGYATTATDAAIQSNIIAARYGQSSTVNPSSSSAVSSSAVVSSSSVAALSSSSVTVVSSSSGPAEAAYSIANIPGLIQIENYNVGGEGSAYHDADAVNSGSKYRTDGVDIDTVTEGGYALGWTNAGEYLEYVVNLSTVGTLSFQARVASALATGAFHLELDGNAITSSIVVPNTGSYSTYQTITGEAQNLIPGSHMLRLVIDSSYFNFDWIQFNDAAVSLLGPVNAIPTGMQSYQILDVMGKYLGTANAFNLQSLRATVHSIFPQPGVYLVRYATPQGMVTSKLVMDK